MNKNLLAAAILHALMVLEADYIHALKINLLTDDRSVQQFTIFVAESQVRAPSYQGLRNDLHIFGEPVMVYPYYFVHNEAGDEITQTVPA